MKTKRELRQTRKFRIRAKIRGTKARPRLSVFRSNRGLYVQLVDDDRGTTLAVAGCRKQNKAEAKSLGLSLAAKAKEKGIARVVFDRGGYRYHGLIQELAQGAREGGLKF